MNERGAFLEMIITNPDDDGPRLVYADWLEEQCNDEDTNKAELIRVQCQLEQWSRKCLKRPLSTEMSSPLSKCCIVCDLRIREGVLLSKIGINRWNPLYRRGFIQQIDCYFRDWLQYWPLMLANDPIQNVNLLDTPIEMPVVRYFFKNDNPRTIFSLLPAGPQEEIKTVHGREFIRTPETWRSSTEIADYITARNPGANLDHPMNIISALLALNWPRIKAWEALGSWFDQMDGRSIRATIQYTPEGIQFIRELSASVPARPNRRHNTGEAPDVGF